MQFTYGRGITWALAAAAVAAVAAGALEPLGMSPAAQIATAILLVATGLWITEAVPLFVTSSVIVLLSVVWLTPAITADSELAPRLANGEADFLAPFASDVILLFLGGFVLSTAMHKYRLDEWLARRILARSGGSYSRLLLAVMGVTAALSMWLSNTATAAMMLALCLPILERLEEGDPRRTGILLSVPFAANLGGLGTPIGTPPNAIVISYLRQTGEAPSFGMWMLIGLPGVCLLLLAAWGVLRWLHPGEKTLPPFSSTPIEIRDRRGVVISLAVAVLTVAGWISQPWHGFSAGTVTLVPFILLFGSGVLEVRDLRALAWDVLLLMGGGLCLGVVMERSGLADWLVAQLPVGGASVLVLCLVFATAACAMSSLMSNTATANLLAPLVMGMHLEQTSAVLVSIAFACSLSMPFPVSTPPNALAFGSGKLTVRQMLSAGGLITLLGLALTLTAGLGWMTFLGLL